jgi:hypothetical protein
MWGVHIGVWARAALERTLAFVCALVLLAPMILGPALGPVTKALGGEPRHLCACGMVAGTCGCPECEKAEHQRQSDNALHSYPVLKGKCAGDETPVTFAPLPAATPALLAFVSPRTPAEPAVPVTQAAWVSLERLRPPTPPPEALPLRS